MGNDDWRYEHPDFDLDELLDGKTPYDAILGVARWLQQEAITELGIAAAYTILGNRDQEIKHTQLSNSMEINAIVLEKMSDLWIQNIYLDATDSFAGHVKATLKKGIEMGMLEDGEVDGLVEYAVINAFNESKREAAARRR